MPQGRFAQETAVHRGTGELPRVRARMWWTRMWRPFWVLPLVICVAAWLAGVFLPLVDAAATQWLPYVFQSGPDGARSLLSTIASAMISVIGLVFSITMVVLLLASVGMFLAFIRHITTSIQVAQVIARLGNQTVEVARGYFPLPDDTRSEPLQWSPPPGTPSIPVTTAAGHGHLTQVDHRALLQAARRSEAVIEVTIRVGRFVVEADWAPGQDPAFGIRQLVDVAGGALSPGINDPTTATQVLDQLHRVLRVLMQRRTPPSVLADGDAVRLVHRPQRVPELLTLAVEEIVHYGRDTIQVSQRIRALLTELLAIAAPEYRPSLQGWLERGPEPVLQWARP